MKSLVAMAVEQYKLKALNISILNIIKSYGFHTFEDVSPRNNNPDSMYIYVCEPKYKTIQLGSMKKAIDLNKASRDIHRRGLTSKPSYSKNTKDLALYEVINKKFDKLAEDSRKAKLISSEAYKDFINKSSMLEHGGAIVRINIKDNGDDTELYLFRIVNPIIQGKVRISDHTWSGMKDWIEQEEHEAYCHYEAKDLTQHPNLSVDDLRYDIRNFFGYLLDSIGKPMSELNIIYKELLNILNCSEYQIEQINKKYEINASTIFEKMENILKGQN